MDPRTRSYDMRAPGASTATPLHCPAADPWPPIDEHIVEPEVTRDEVLRGERYEATPANPEHAEPHSQLDYVARAHVAPGYTSATDMITRFSHQSDFAPDTSILRKGIDPSTGTRYLEELAFEVVNEQ